VSVLKDSGARREFDTGAVRDVAAGKGRMDLLPMRALKEVSKLYEEGCIKYGDRNWEKGISTHCYVDSMLRHMANFMAGMDDEPHLVQACWNALCLLDTILRVREGALPPAVHDLPMAIDSIRLFTPPAPADAAA